MLKLLGILFLIIIGFLCGYVTAVYGIHQDIKGDKELITKWINKHG